MDLSMTSGRIVMAAILSNYRTLTIPILGALSILEGEWTSCGEGTRSLTRRAGEMTESDLTTGARRSTVERGKGFGYLIDIDGVIYRGGRLIKGVDRFIADLRERD